MPDYQKNTQIGTDKGGNPIYQQTTEHYKKKNTRRRGGKKRRKLSSFQKAVDVEGLLIRKVS